MKIARQLAIEHALNGIVIETCSSYFKGSTQYLLTWRVEGMWARTTARATRKGWGDGKLTRTTWESASSAGLPLRTSRLDLIFRNDRLKTRLEGLSVDEDIETGLSPSSSLGEPPSGVWTKAVDVVGYFFGVSGLGSVRR